MYRINVDILVFQWQSVRGKFSQSLSEKCHYLELLSDTFVVY